MTGRVRLTGGRKPLATSLLTGPHQNRRTHESENPFPPGAGVRVRRSSAPVRPDGPRKSLGRADFGPGDCPRCPRSSRRRPEGLRFPADRRRQGRSDRHTVGTAERRTGRRRQGPGDADGRSGPGPACASPRRGGAAWSGPSSSSTRPRRTRSIGRTSASGSPNTSGPRQLPATNFSSRDSTEGSISSPAGPRMGKSSPGPSRRSPRGDRSSTFRDRPPWARTPAPPLSSPTRGSPSTPTSCSGPSSSP